MSSSTNFRMLPVRATIPSLRPSSVFLRTAVPQHRGGFSADAKFDIAGDLHADPLDGAAEKSMRDGGANLTQRGAPAQDTSDFKDRNAGNLRLNYVLPSKSLQVLDAGVFWPADRESGHELVDASDYRLTWIDIEL